MNSAGGTHNSVTKYMRDSRVEMERRARGGEQRGGAVLCLGECPREATPMNSLP